MPCPQPNYTPGNQERADATSLEGVEAVSPSRYLVVSDAPETINPEVWTRYPHMVGQLYRCQIRIPNNGTLHLRVFLWHVNEMGETHRIWIVLRTGSGTATLSDHRALAPAPPEYRSLHERGICLAKAQLFGTITEAGDHTGTNLTSTSDVGLGNHQVANHGTLTAIHEFTVIGSAGQVLDLRTIITKERDFGEPYNQCLKPDEHIRGWWPFSKLLAHAPAWDVGAAPVENGNEKHFSICQPGGADQRVFAWQGESADRFGTEGGNRGLYGVNARYRVYLYNSQPHNRYVSFNLRARDTRRIPPPPEEPPKVAPAYFGAALALEEDDRPTLGGVPPIKHTAEGPVRDPDACRIRVSDLLIPANTTQPIVGTVKNATAGGATLPVDLRLVASPVATPIEDGP